MHHHHSHHKHEYNQWDNKSNRRYLFHYLWKMNILFCNKGLRRKWTHCCGKYAQAKKILSFSQFCQFSIDGALNNTMFIAIILSRYVMAIYRMTENKCSMIFFLVSCCFNYYYYWADIVIASDDYKKFLFVELRKYFLFVISMWIF